MQHTCSEGVRAVIADIVRARVPAFRIKGVIRETTKSTILSGHYCDQREILKILMSESAEHKLWFENECDFYLNHFPASQEVKTAKPLVVLKNDGVLVLAELPGVALGSVRLFQSDAPQAVHAVVEAIRSVEDRRRADGFHRRVGRRRLHQRCRANDVEIVRGNMGVKVGW
jgi:hypothetical protein